MGTYLERGCVHACTQMYTREYTIVYTRVYFSPLGSSSTLGKSATRDRCLYLWCMLLYYFAFGL